MEVFDGFFDGESDGFLPPFDGDSFLFAVDRNDDAIRVYTARQVIHEAVIYALRQERCCPYDHLCRA